jgi:hypothetical protein
MDGFRNDHVVPASQYPSGLFHLCRRECERTSWQDLIPLNLACFADTRHQKVALSQSTVIAVAEFLQ